MNAGSQESPRTAQEVAQGAEENPLARLLDEYLPDNRLQRGQVLRGVVLRVSSDAILVDVGVKCEGTISGRELEQVDPALSSRLEPGDQVTVYVINPEGPCGELVLSLTQGQTTSEWEQAQALLESGATISLNVILANRGGLIVQLGRLRGFVPASQLAPSRCVPRISDPACGDVLNKLVGASLKVRVIEADQNRNRLILSERPPGEQNTPRNRAQLVSKLTEGEIRRGRVSNLTDFGAFVDLGGIDGLVHLSEIAWNRVEHPSDVLKVGQELTVMVLNIDHERQRVALSIKRLETDPWVMAAERYQAGQLVDCRITRLTKWGAFACVVGDEAIEGLIHVSELDERHVVQPDEIVQTGQVLRLRVVRVQPERHRLALSLRQVAGWETPDEMWAAGRGAPPPESAALSATSEAAP
jgi:small subunit ribosomal protein S1